MCDICLATLADVVTQIFSKRMDNNAFCLYMALVYSNWLLFNRDRNKDVVRCSIIDTIIISDHKITFCRDTKLILEVELLTSFMVSYIWLFPDGSLDPCYSYTFPTSTGFSWVTFDWVIHCNCAFFQSWSCPSFSRASATPHPPLLSGNARGISLVVLHSV